MLSTLLAIRYESDPKDAVYIYIDRYYNLGMLWGLFILCILAILGNTLVMKALIKERETKFKALSHYFIISLSSTDLGLCLCTSVCYIFTLTAGAVDPAVCAAQAVIVCTFCCQSVIMLGLIAAERYQAIVLRDSWTDKQGHKYVFTGWIISILFGLLSITPLGGASTGNMGGSCKGAWSQPGARKVQCIIAVLIICVASVKISHSYLKIFKHTQATLDAAAQYRKARPQNEGHRDSADVLKAKVARKLSYLVVFFFACWASYTVMMLYEVLWEERAPRVLDYVGTFLAILNSTINPMLYAYLNKQYRVAMRNVVYTMFGLEIPKDSFHDAEATVNRQTTLTSKGMSAKRFPNSQSTQLASSHKKSRNPLPNSRPGSRLSNNNSRSGNGETHLVLVRPAPVNDEHKLEEKTKPAAVDIAPPTSSPKLSQVAPAVEATPAIEVFASPKVLTGEENV